MKLIIVTRQIDGEKMYVNPEQICAIYPYHKKESTVIQFSGTKEKYLDVKESPESIACMIANIEPERKTGKWELLPLSIIPPVYKCSACGRHAVWITTGCLVNRHEESYLSDFCPSCGADMRGEKI